MNVFGEIVDILSYSLLVLTIAVVTGNVGYWGVRWVKAKAKQAELEVEEIRGFNDDHI